MATELDILMAAAQARQEEPQDDLLSRLEREARVRADAKAIILRHAPAKVQVPIGAGTVEQWDWGYLWDKGAKEPRKATPHEYETLRAAMADWGDVFDEDEKKAAALIMSHASSPIERTGANVERIAYGAANVATLGTLRRFGGDIEQAGMPAATGPNEAEVLQAVGGGMALPVGFAQWGAVSKGVGATAKAVTGLKAAQKAGTALAKVAGPVVEAAPGVAKVAEAVAPVAKAAAQVGATGGIIGAATVAGQVAGTELPVSEQISQIAGGGANGLLVGAIFGGAIGGVSYVVSGMASAEAVAATTAVQREMEKFKEGIGDINALAKAQGRLTRAVRAVGFTRGQDVGQEDWWKRNAGAMQKYRALYKTADGRAALKVMENALNQQGTSVGKLIPSVTGEPQVARAEQVPPPPTEPQPPKVPTAPVQTVPVAPVPSVTVPPIKPVPAVPQAPPTPVARAVPSTPIVLESAISQTLSPDVMQGRVQEPDILVSKDPKRRLESGQPIEVKVYAGSGRTVQGEVYGEGAKGPILGPAKYYAVTPTVAMTFGPNVEESTVVLRNPYVLEDDQDLSMMLGVAVGKIPLGGTPRSDEARRDLLSYAPDYIRDGGYDGVIVVVPQYRDEGRRGRSAKRLREYFGDTQVIVFPWANITAPTTPATTVPPEAMPVAEAPPTGAVGKDTTVFWTGGSFPAQYQVVEVKDVIASHDLKGGENPAFPQELQPRITRGSKLSMQLVKERAAKLNFEELGASPNASYGAPVLSPEGTIDAGSGRYLSTVLSFEQGKVEAYKKWLVEKAADLGLDPAAIQKMDEPILVRRRTCILSDQTIQDFVADANVSKIQKPSKTEQAIRDSEIITAPVAEKLTPLADGTFSTNVKNPFVADFVSGVPKEERPDLLTPDGKDLTADGKRRIEAAILVRALGGKDLSRDELNGLSALVETQGATESVKNIVSGLLRAAPTLVKVQAAEEAGALKPGSNPVPHIRAAIPVIRTARHYQENAKVDLVNAVDEVSKQSLFKELVPTPEAVIAAKFLAANIRSPTAIGEGLTALGKVALDPRYQQSQGMLPGMEGERPGLGKLWERMQAQVQAAQAAGQTQPAPAGELGTPVSMAMPLEPGPPEVPLNPISRQKIVKALSKAMGNLPIHTGGFRTRIFKLVRAGIYKIGPRVIRTAEADDLNSTAHEVGHDIAIAKHWGKKGVLPEPERAELMALGKKLYKSFKGAKAVNEGAAEYVRTWLTDPPMAPQVAPEFTKRWEATLAADPQLNAAMMEAQSGIRQYRWQGAMARTSAQIISLSEAEAMSKKSLSQWVKEFYQACERALTDEKEVLRRFEASTGHNDPRPTRSVYEMHRLLLGNVGEGASWILESGPGKPGRGQQDALTWEVTGPSHDDINKKIRDEGRIHELDMLKVARQVRQEVPRIIEARGGKPPDAPVHPELMGLTDKELEQGRHLTGLTLADELAVLEVLEKDDELVRAANGCTQFMQGVLKFGVDSEILPPGTLETWSADKEQYAPLFRFFDGLGNVEWGGEGGNQPFRRRGGSARPVLSPTEMERKFTISVIAAGERNLARLQALDIATKAGADGRDWIENIDKPLQPVPVKVSEVLSVMRKAGVNVEGVSDKLAEKVLQVFRPSIFAPPGTTGIYVKGKLQFYMVEPTLRDALETLAKHENSMFLGVLQQTIGVPKTIFQGGIVYTIEFLIRNLIMRDMLGGMVSSDYLVIPVYHTYRGLAGVLGRTEDFKLYFEAGGRSGMAMSADVSKRPDITLVRLKGVRGGEGTGIVAKFKTPLKTLLWLVTRPRALADMLARASEIGEAAGRNTQNIVAADAVRKKYPGWSIKDVAMAARAEADEAHGPFWRFGWLARYLNQMIPFWNPGGQSSVSVLRRAVGRPHTITAGEGRRSFRFRSLQSFWIKGLMLTAITTALYFRNRKKAAYQELSEMEKDYYWWSDVGDDEWFKVSKPWEIGMIFAAAPERFLRYLDTKDPKSFDHLAGNFASVALPGAMPLVLRPPVEVFANKDMFWGTPIVPEYRKDLAPYLQYRPSTTELAKEIGKRAGVSPAIMEHYVRGYGGTLAIDALRALDVTMQAAGMLPDARSPKPPMTPDRWPVLAAFLKRGLTYAKSIQEFYDQRRSNIEAMETVKELTDTDRKDEALQYAQGHRDELLRYKNDEATAKKLTKLRQDMEVVYGSPVLTPRQKVEEAARLNKEMVNLAREALGKPRLE